MLGNELRHGNINPHLSSVSKEGILLARGVKLLSDREACVEVVEDPTGFQFVRRIYSSDTLSARTADIPFAEAWQARNDMFTASGINIVPHIVFRKDMQNKRIVVVSEYANNTSIVNASLQDKLKLAEGLAKVLTASGRFLPSLQSFAHDMFRTKIDEAGNSRIVLVDLDPYLIEKPNSEEDRDYWFSLYLKRITELIRGHWIKPQENSQVMGTFVLNAGLALQQIGILDHDKTQMAFIKAHLASQRNL